MSSGSDYSFAVGNEHGEARLVHLQAALTKLFSGQQPARQASNGVVASFYVPALHLEATVRFTQRTIEGKLRKTAEIVKVCFEDGHESQSNFEAFVHLLLQAAAELETLVYIQHRMKAPFSLH